MLERLLLGFLVCILFLYILRFEFASECSIFMILVVVVGVVGYYLDFFLVLIYLFIELLVVNGL